MSENFCVVPWRQLSTKPNGNLRICCLMMNSSDPDKGVLRREDGTIYNGRDNDFLESMNAQKIKQLRVDILEGRKSDLCVACWEKESVGLKSKRIVSNRIFKEEFTEEIARQQTKPCGEISELKLGYLDLRFGNLCNLKCIMCHPASSSSWYRDYAKIFETDFFRDTQVKVKLKKISDQEYGLEDSEYFKWYESDSFWTHLESQMENVKQIYLVGGEPLMIRKHFSFLEKCVQSGISENITLEYDTNLTVINPKILELWKRFKKIKFRISIDSTGKFNDYIRYPSDWDQIESNLKIISDELKNIELDFSMTWQIYNLFKITKIWEKYPSLGSVRILSHPSYLDIKILPRELKEKALHHLEGLSFEHQKITDQVESMKNYLIDNLDFKDEKALSQFAAYTQKCDQVRNTNVVETFPELSPLFM